MSFYWWDIYIQKYLKGFCYPLHVIIDKYMICNETYRMNSCAITISALTLVYFMLVILVRRDIVVLIQIPYATLRVHQGPSTACNSYSNRHTICTILPRIENVLLTITLPQAQLLICKDKMVCHCIRERVWRKGGHYL